VERPNSKNLHAAVRSRWDDLRGIVVVVACLSIISWKVLQVSHWMIVRFLHEYMIWRSR
jgi:hypothetical protein